MSVLPAALCTTLLMTSVWAQSAPIESADPPSGEGAMAPNLTRIADGIALTWLEPLAGRMGSSGGRSYRLRFSVYKDGAWRSPVTIVEGGDFFANWADIPSCQQSSDGTLIAHWLQKSGEGTYAYDVMLARSTDGGATWATIGKLNDDATETEHGFVSLIPEGDTIRAFWLDGRAVTADRLSDDARVPGDMGLRTAVITDQIGPSTLLDPRVCECCDTSAAMTARGPIVIYRNRSAIEVRDMSVVRQRGDAWTEPQTVHDDNWKIPGCPVNGPAIAARGEIVVVVWFTAASGPKVFASYSFDSGKTFAEPLRIDDAGASGRVAVELLESHDAIVGWIGAGADRESAAVKLRKISPNGDVGPSITVGETSFSRASGFPKIQREGDDLLVVWTIFDTRSQLRVAVIKLNAIPAAGSDELP